MLDDFFQPRLLSDNNSIEVIREKKYAQQTSVPSLALISQSILVQCTQVYTYNSWAAQL